MKEKLIIVFLISFIKLSFQFDVEITVFEGSFEFEKYSSKEISLLDASVLGLKSKLEKNILTYGKIYYYESLEKFKETVLQYHNINYRWIILIDSIPKHDEFVKFINDLANNKIIDKLGKNIVYDINGIVYHSIDDSGFLNVDGFTPYIKVSKDVFDNLNTKYSISNLENNVFLKYTIKKVYSTYQSTASLFIAIGYFAISLGVVAFLFYKVKQINPLDQEVYKLLYWLYILMLLNLVIYIYILTGLTEGKDSPMRYYSLTVLNATESVYKSLVWFYLILLAYGWKSYYSFFSRNDMRWLIFVFIFIYLIFSLDFIIISITDILVFSNFNLIDLKTLIFGLVLASYSIFCCYRGMTKIRVRKLNIKSNFKKILDKNVLYDSSWD